MAEPCSMVNLVCLFMKPHLLAWASAEIFPGRGKADILLIFFRLLMLTIRSANRRGNRATPPQKIVQQKISPGCGSMTMKCKCRTLTKRFTLSTRHIGVGAGNFLDVQNTPCPNSANLPEKRLCDKHSCCKLSVAIGSVGIQIFCRPVLLQKSYFPAGSVTKCHIFQQMN